jgi:hypothetical protein
MIDDELLAKFVHIQDLPVSEEMLGAYTEGNVTDSEHLQISLLADSSSEISSLLCEVKDIDVEKLASVFYDFNQIDFIVDTKQELPNIDEYTLSKDYQAIPVNIETMGAELLDSFEYNTLESHIDSDNSPIENEDLFITSDSSEQDDHSLDTNSNADCNTDFESEESDFNNLDL